MSKADTPDSETVVEQFREQVRETFEPYMKSKQALDVEGIPPEERHQNHERRHNDGEAMYRNYGMGPLAKQLRTASKKKHPVEQYPQAFAHLITHLTKWEKWELGKNDPDFSELPRTRRLMLEWFLEDDDRMQRLRPGGTGLLVHGEQGTTKTTMLYFVLLAVMQINPFENTVWQASFDDSEWTLFAPYATLCLPAGVDVEVEADPYDRKYTKSLGAQNVPLQIDDIARDVVRYENIEDLMRKMAARTAGQMYVVYPDPRFRQAEDIIGHEYEVGETNVKQWWFPFWEELVHGTDYNEWTSVFDDEAHKWLHRKAEGDWWHRIQGWSASYGDARKGRVSAFLGGHEWSQFKGIVRKKIRWGATMNGEPYPSKAPRDGDNDRQGLGQSCVWTKTKWNHIGYPDLKRHCSVPADIHVTFPSEEVETYV